MGYIDENLMNDEEVVRVTRLHPIVLLVPAMTTSFLAGVFSMFEDHPIALLVSGICLIFEAFRLVDKLVLFMTSEFGITTKRVLGKTGFLQRSSLDIVLAKVEAIRLNQSVMGRIFNFGSIEVTGTGGTEEILKFIPDPLNFRNCVQEQIWKISKEHDDNRRLMDA